MLSLYLYLYIRSNYFSLKKEYYILYIYIHLGKRKYELNIYNMHALYVYVATLSFIVPIYRV